MKDRLSTPIETLNDTTRKSVKLVLSGVKTRLSELRKSRANYVLHIQIPFFGVSFDINDLGVFSGITFVIILIMFRYSLSRELDNLTYIFNLVNSEQHSPFYSLLRMRQVLTVPPTELDDADGFWKRLPRAFIWVPVIIHLAILINDFYTYDIGKAVSEGRTKLSILFSGIFLNSITILAYHCNRIWKGIDKRWEAEFSEMQPKN